jgi:hypothetical protein
VRAAAAAFAVSRIVLLFFHTHAATDLKLYREWLLRASAGQIAFRDFPIEYPPLAWWVMHLPGTTERAAYYFRFRLMMGAADLLAFALLWWMVAVRRPAAVGSVLGTYVLSTVALEFVLFDRLDLLMLTLILAGLAAWVRADTGAAVAGWRTVAYAAIGLGAAYKLLPVVCLPLLALSDLMTTPRWRSVVGRVLLGLAVIVLPFAVNASASGLASLDFLRYHTTRGVEIGSSWATILWLVSRSDPTLSVVAAYGSWELSGRLSDTAARLAPFVAMGWLGCIGLWALALRRRFDGRRAVLQCALALAGLVLVLDVFSVQYLLWALPLMALAGSELSDSRQEWFAVGAACVVIAALSTLFYPFAMRYVVPLNAGVMLLLAVRNALYAGVVAWLVWRAVRADRVAAAP